MSRCPSRVGRPLNDDRCCVRLNLYRVDWVSTQLVPNTTQRSASGVLVVDVSAGASASAAPPIRQCPDAFRDYVSVLWPLSPNCTRTENLVVGARNNLCHDRPGASPMGLELQHPL